MKQYLIIHLIKVIKRFQRQIEKVTQLLKAIVLFYREDLAVLSNQRPDKDKT